MLDTTNPQRLREIAGDFRLVAFDEAQTIPDIGLKLKILHDAYPDIQLIATGSSAFDLKQVSAEPLTGRSREYYLYPLSYREIAGAYSPVDAYASIESMLQFGSYPQVFGKSEAEKREEIISIASNYLYRDILELTTIRHAGPLYNLVKSLAFQIGREVSLNELSNRANISVHTVSRYLDILEKGFVITSLGSFSRNLRKEIGKARKYYFLDCGIRNAIINNFNPIGLRDDVGQLWENFCVMERIKRNEYDRKHATPYFWRTYDQKEIDYLEETDGRLHAYEFKWSETKGKIPRVFLNAYPSSSFQLVHKQSLMEFIG